MNISKSYVNIVQNVAKNIADNMREMGGVSGQVASRGDSSYCEDNLEGDFIVTGDQGYRAEEGHLAAAMVRVRCVRNATTIWHVTDAGRKRVLVS